MFSVYKMSIKPLIYKVKGSVGSTNAYNVGRSESWTIIEDSKFETEEEALDYVIRKNIEANALGFCVGEGVGDVYEIYKTVILSQQFLHKQMYYLGKPERNNIIRLLREDGIRVIMD